MSTEGTDPASDDIDSVGSVAHEGVGKAAARGMPWLFLTNVLTKLLSLVAQIVLGLLLAPDDFGVYALAIAAIMIIQAVQDGGAREYLLQQGRARFQELSCDAFWMSVAMNLLMAVVLAAGSGLLGDFYDEPRLPPVLVICAASIPLNAFWSIASAALILDFRFAAFGTVFTIGAVVQYSGMALCAALGLGVLSFVIPLPVAALVKAVGGIVASGNRPWRQRPHIKKWGPMFSATRWLVLAAVATALVNQGDYMVIGAVTTSAVLGYYYFAYQVPAQLGVFAGSLGGTLLSALSRLPDPKEKAAALLRTLRVLTLFLAASAMLLTLSFPYLEGLLWHGKWERSIDAVLVFCLFTPFSLLYVIARTAFLASSRFRAWSIATIAEGLGLIVVVWLSGHMVETATGFALWTGIYLSVSVVALVVWSFRIHKTRPTHVLAAIGLTYLPSGLGYVAARGASLVYSHSDVSFINVCLMWGVFAITTSLVARFTVPSVLRDSTAMLPSRVCRLVRRLLLL